MGGGVSTRVLTVSQDINSAVLYAAMSGDERKNYEAIHRWSASTLGMEELSVPTNALSLISPMNFFEDITSPISIHHGMDDKLVCVPVDDPRFENVKDIDDISAHLQKEISHFFEVYKALEPNKWVKVKGLEGAEKAKEVIDHSIDLFKRLEE